MMIYHVADGVTYS